MMVSPALTNPFPGLRPFELDEEHLFFGREGQADELVRRLERNRLLAVVGTSGSGKSSLVRAGLLPCLYSGFLPGASSNWRVAVLRPGNAPMGNLALALHQPQVLGVELSGDDRVIRTALAESTLRRGELGLVEVVQQARLTATENLLVVVDQFEELFRFKARSQGQGGDLLAEEEAAAFVKLLLAAVGQRQVPIFVVLTLRSDFLGDCAQFRHLPESLNDSQYLIPRLTRDQLRRAIEGPVAVGGATITPRLVNRLLNDTGDNPDQLPILQHALMRTWDHWRDRHSPEHPLDIPDYEAIGGMAQALSRHADQIYGGLPDDRARQIAEVLFRCLTDRVGNDSDVRRPTELQEIVAVANATEAEVTTVIEAFRAPQRSFLMPPPPLPLTAPTVVDISHESLIRNWDTLKDWVTREGRSATIYRRLAETAALHRQGEADYLRDPELTIDLTWQRERQPNPTWGQRYAPNFEEAMAFLSASAEVRTSEAAERDAARRREINRLRGFIALLGSLTLLAGGGIVYARLQQAETYQQTLRVTTQGAAFEAETLLAAGLNFRAWLAILEGLKDVQHLKREEATRLQAVSVLREVVYDTSWREKNTFKIGEVDENASGAVLGLSHDSQRIASAHNDGTVKIWTLGDNAPPVVLEDHSAQVNWIRVNRISFSDDDRLIATSSRDGTIRLWDAQSGQPIGDPLQGHQDSVNSVAFSPDGQFFASASKDGTARVWDSSGNLKGILLANQDRRNTIEVNTLRFSRDGKFLATGDQDGRVRLWELDKLNQYYDKGSKGFLLDIKGQLVPGSVLQDPEGTEKPWSKNTYVQEYRFKVNPWEKVLIHLESEDFDPYMRLLDDEVIAENNDRGFKRPSDAAIAIRHQDEVKTYRIQITSAKDKETGAYRLLITSVESEDVLGGRRSNDNGHREPITSLDFFPPGSDEPKVLSASEDGTVKLWNTKKPWIPEQTLAGHGSFVNFVRLDRDGKVITSFGGDQTIKRWGKPEPNNNFLNPRDRDHQVLDISFILDSQDLATVSKDGTIKLWDPKTGKELHTLAGHTDEVSHVSFASDGQTLATASKDGTIKLWNPKTGKELHTLAGHTDEVSHVSFASDGQTLATASKDGTIKLWNLKTGKELHTLAGHQEPVLSLVFDPDSQDLASASSDRTVKLWDSKTGEELRSLEGHTDEVNHVSFASKGKTLATASKDGTIKLWNPKTGKKLHTLAGHQGSVLSVTFIDPKGQTLASASQDSTVKLWDSNTGKELQSLEGHWGRVQKLTFDPKGQTLASVSNDGTIILWNLNLEDLMERSCGWLADYMANPATPPEEKALCKGYLPVSRPLSFWAPWHWLGQVRGFWQGLGVPLGGKSPSLGELRPSRADAEQGPPEDKLAEGVATRP